MMQHIKNIYRLGVKELLELCSDVLLMVLIVYSVSLSVIVEYDASPDSVTKATIAIVDEDHSQLSHRITDAMLPPMFLPPVVISREQMDAGMDDGEYTFVVVLPMNLERDVRAGKNPQIQLNVDATRMSQAFTGNGYIADIISMEISRQMSKDSSTSIANANIRNMYNQNLTTPWFESVVQLLNSVAMLSIILTGSALIRERESGTLEHLLVMPVAPFEIMVAKIWSMMLVVLIASGLSLIFVVQMYLKIPFAGSYFLFMCGMALNLFAITSLGIFLGCVGKSMPQLGMLLILILMPLQMLSGGSTPQESMPVWIQTLMKAAPTTHIVNLTEAIIFRGVGIEVAWTSFIALFIIGAILFTISLILFKRIAAQS